MPPCSLHDLALDALYVVYPGERRYGQAERVEAVRLSAVLPMARRHGYLRASLFSSVSSGAL